MIEPPQHISYNSSKTTKS